MAIHAALAGEHEAGTLRIVCFLTDGFVGNEFEAAAEDWQAGRFPRRS